VRCSSHGCACNSCQTCGERHESCVCDLVKKTREFLNRTDSDMDGQLSNARQLLQEWLIDR
jgi:hypothetical protein